jgi:hypothetical protein
VLFRSEFVRDCIEIENRKVTRMAFAWLEEVTELFGDAIDRRLQNVIAEIRALDELAL